MGQDILLLLGTRPEAIKMAPLALELARHKGIRSRVCLTGQHRELLEQAVADFGLRPWRRLDVMEEAQTLSGLTARLLSELTGVLRESRPNLILVHGDTTTAFAGALAAFYLQIPVGHVEAGLRSGDLSAPFPEEFNRIAIDRLARWHFAPTPGARENLLREGCAAEGIVVTGNTVVDAMRLTLREDFTHPALDWAGKRPLVLLTAHRRENFAAMGRLFAAIQALARHRPDVAFLFPVHPNPRVRKLAYGLLGGLDNLKLVNPLGVAECHNLLARCAVVLTDSGGLQEEASALCRPVLVLREVTERPEGVTEGKLRLVGTEGSNLLENFDLLLENRTSCDKIQLDIGLWGDGYASHRIVSCLEGASASEWTPLPETAEHRRFLILSDWKENRKEKI